MHHKVMLDEILEYNHYPLPAICTQSVWSTGWFFLIFSALAFQPCDHCKYDDKGNFLCKKQKDKSLFIKVIILFLF